MAKTRSVYVCQNCGVDSPKWIGKCPSCGEWNTFVEEIIHKENSSSKISMAGFEPIKQKTGAYIQRRDSGWKNGQIPVVTS